MPEALLVFNRIRPDYYNGWITDSTSRTHWNLAIQYLTNANF
ncbi:hypothetical protein C943_01748 [Mariniradius saccharolyticus AK6]|uniref:Uncharacterized protein n=1 Tax=Mariniradius saccharolyticus AK6 TaxID=1239962 RepID=M7XBM9_9BACT|nr:hypothetical protein C943_01748 [Mariniradius saccharolyticus AK6]